MQPQRILFTILLCLFFTTCKKDSINSPGQTNEELAFQSYQMMESAARRFIEIGDSMDVAPPEALYYTSQWAQNQPGVEYAQTLDSAYLIIHMTSGYESKIALREIGIDGLSVYRGSAAGTGQLSKTVSSTGGDCSNTIQNKKVLLYAAYEHEFYAAGEFQTRVVDMIENGDVDVDVTVLKNEECTIDALLTFDQYGLIILDTHGSPSGIFSGIEFSLDSTDIPNSVDGYLSMIGGKIGAQHIQSVIDLKIQIGYAFEYEPQLQIQEQWDKYKDRLAIQYQVELISKGVREMLPDLSNTIVFANACYSGWTATEWTRSVGSSTGKNSDPIKPAWMTKNPLTFYGYESVSDGVSYKAPDADFCKPNEDTIIKSFFYDGDSTGNAHLADGFGGALFLEYPWSNDIGMNNNHGPLRFNQYASPSWCYGNCGDTITDIRDGQQYPTVCIGEQVWMAKNLNWAGSGVCYDNNASNCNTYGRLYSITELTGLDTSNANPSTVVGLCPEGWHVPSRAEWDELFTVAGNIEKLRTTTGWPLPNQNTNELGLSLLPGGHFVADVNNSQFSSVGEYGYFWTSSGTNNGEHYAAAGFSTNNWYGPPSVLTWKFSCRCVKD